MTVMTPLQVILFLGFSSAAFGYSTARDDSVLVGPAYCAKGQAAWCLNFTTAVDCNAFTHCLQAVWRTQKAPSVVGSCSGCEAQIQNIRQGIDSNTTKEVLKELLENVCDLTIVTELFRKRCEKFVDQYVDTNFNYLLDLLKSDMDPATICHILGFCSTVNDSPLMTDAETVVRFENIVLHLPADLVDVDASQKLVGAKKCTWGPSYWCHNLTTSKECQSTSHCINAYWSKQQFANDDDSVCKVCKDMVQQARDQLQSNETQEELREVFEGSCKLIPIKEVRNECMKLADEFVPELTEMLVSEMNPTVICTVAGLCNSLRIDHLLESAAIQSGDSCANCTAAVTAAERYIQHAPRGQVREKLLRLCNQLSSFSDACTDIVYSGFDHIYTMISAELRPFPVCHMSGMCAQRYHKHSSDDDDLQTKVDTILAADNDDLPCDLCKQLVKHLKDVLTTNTTEEEFREILEGICQHSKSFKNECLEIVDENFVKIYKFLTEELSPEDVCREVNLCPRGSMLSDENMMLIDSHAPSPAEFTELAVSNPKVSDVECRLCRVVIGIIQKEMNKPEYEHDIEKLLGKVCSLAPRSDREKCDKFIEQYADVLIKLLADQTDPGIVCQMLGLCPDSITARNELCPICQYVMHFVEEELEKPEEQRKVEDVIRKVCRYAPRSEKSECESFVNDYASLIMSVLSEELDPSLVCPALKLCPQVAGRVARCSHCQDLMGHLISALGDDRSEQKVRSALKAFVPPTNADSGVTAVQLKVVHQDDVVDMMSAEFSAQESCVYLEFCDVKMLPAATVHEETNDIAEVTAELPTKPSCELCELMVQLYVDKLTSNSTEEEIEADLQKVCAKIKNPEFRSNCSFFVHKYVPQVVKLLKKDVKAEEVCSLVKLCPPKMELENGNDRCELCEAVVGLLEGVSSDPAMISKSIKYLLEICDWFQKPSEHTNCMKVISYVGPQLESVALGIPSWYYCTKIHFCPYGAHLNYKQVCRDPTQWCKDKTTALLCGQLSHCMESEWISDKPSL